MVAVDKFGGIGVEMADGVGKNIADAATQQAARAKIRDFIHHGRAAPADRPHKKKARHEGGPKFREETP